MIIFILGTWMFWARHPSCDLAHSQSHYTGVLIIGCPADACILCTGPHRVSCTQNLTTKYHIFVKVRSKPWQIIGDDTRSPPATIGMAVTYSYRREEPTEISSFTPPGSVEEVDPTRFSLEEDCDPHPHRLSAHILLLTVKVPLLFIHSAIRCLYF